MQLYPSIDNKPNSKNIYAFDKLDGSNIRAEWRPKTGFMKFGTRRRLLSAEEEPLGEAIELIMNTHADTLNTIFSTKRWDKVTVFFEFYGKSSFAGSHEDEQHVVSLVDAHIYKQGMLPPKEFIKLFDGKVLTPEVLHEGKATEQFITSVKNSTLDGMTFEGVVCKGGTDKHGNVDMFKVKSLAWLQKLKFQCAGDEKMFELLQ